MHLGSAGRPRHTTGGEKTSDPLDGPGAMRERLQDLLAAVAVLLTSRRLRWSRQCRWHSPGWSVIPASSWPSCAPSAARSQRTTGPPALSRNAAGCRPSGAGLDLDRVERRLPEVLNTIGRWCSSEGDDRLRLLVTALDVRLRASREMVEISGSVPLIDSSDQTDLVTTARTSPLTSAKRRAVLLPVPKHAFFGAYALIPTRSLAGSRFSMCARLLKSCPGQCRDCIPVEWDGRGLSG